MCQRFSLSNDSLQMFRVGPEIESIAPEPIPNSSIFVLPSIIEPFSSRRTQGVASQSGIKFSSILNERERKKKRSILRSQHSAGHLPWCTCRSNVFDTEIIFYSNRYTIQCSQRFIFGPSFWRLIGLSCRSLRTKCYEIIQVFVLICKLSASIYNISRIQRFISITLRQLRTW